MVDYADIRHLPLTDRRDRLAKLLRRAKPGIRVSEHIAVDGATVFRHACKLGFEGIVSKRIDAPYRSGRGRTWIKVRNKKAPAYTRIEEIRVSRAWIGENPNYPHFPRSALSISALVLSSNCVKKRGSLAFRSQSSLTWSGSS